MMTYSLTMHQATRATIHVEVSREGRLLAHINGPKIVPPISELGSHRRRSDTSLQSHLSLRTSKVVLKSGEIVVQCRLTPSHVAC